MDQDWSATPLTSKLKDRAWSQLGTSGSGNHFVEFGELTVLDDAVGLARGNYLALLSHSGSRGTGAQIAQHYSQLARKMHPELPQELSQLAWLDLSTNAGQEYWAAMELMGRYARSFRGRHTSTDYQDRIKAISEEARVRFGLHERRMRGTIKRHRDSGMIQLALVS